MTLLPLGLAACGKAEEDEFRAGVPVHEAVAITVPGASSNNGSLTIEERSSALQGTLDDLYVATRNISVMVNTGTLAVLGLVHAIVAYPPTTVAKDQAVWGPHTDALSPNTWKLTVTRTAPREYDYVLQGKAKTAADTAFVTVLSGHHVIPTSGLRREGYGSGHFSLDWNAAATLPEHDKNVGQLAITYAHDDDQADVSVDAVFTQVKDDATNMLTDATYHYKATPQDGGEFSWNQQKDYIATTAALETLTIHSRWQQTGAGRADVKLTGGDLSAQEATVSQCWDTNFLSIYRVASYEPGSNYGSEAVCAFSPAVFATL
jgi:hypothetical protein